MNPSVALASTRAARYLDVDLPLLQPELRTRGIDSSVVDWDDHAVDWSRFDLVVIRSTWNYQLQLPDYVQWVDYVAGVSRIANPPTVVRWNTDKRYLRDLALAGIPVVPTTFVAPGQSFELPEVHDFVVKPAISAGSKDTERYSPATVVAARAHVERLLDAARMVMIQPYVESVDLLGETGLIFFGGQYSHAVRKGPMLLPGTEEVANLYKAEDITSREPEPAERDLAERVLDAVPVGRESLLYARVDLVMSDDGPRLLELELTEPSVFLEQAHHGAARFATAIVQAVTTTT